MKTLLDDAKVSLASNYHRADAIPYPRQRAMIISKKAASQSFLSESPHYCTNYHLEVGLPVIIGGFMLKLESLLSLYLPAW